MKTKHLALRVAMNSFLMILVVYLVMQVFTYFRDNLLIGVRDISALPAVVLNFVGVNVIPPLVVFSVLVYLAALPLEKALRRLQAGETLEDRVVEATRLKMLRFSSLILAVNLIGFALGYVIQLWLQGRIASLVQPWRLVILVSNLAAGAVYAQAQTSLNNLAFAELRERLALREIGPRKRETRATIRQMLLTAFFALYALTFVQFNVREVVAFQELERTTLAAVATGKLAREDAAADFRERLAASELTIVNRPGFDAGTAPLPWERAKIQENVQRDVFFLFLVFIFAIALAVQGICSYELREEIAALIGRIKGVVEGDSDLTRRLNLRRMDELGELSELVNRLLDRFSEVVKDIGVAVAKTRDGASAIDLVLQAAESTSEQTGEAVLALTGDLEAQTADSRVLSEALEAVRAAAAGVGAAVEKQRRFAADTAAAMEEMAANIRSVESMTQRASALTETLSERGVEGSSAVSETGKAIAEIEEASSAVRDVLGSLTKISGDTNLLAMNAAIEAAHAGDRGAGFAVVADEVRTLASTAGSQTKSIKSLLGEMSERVKRGVRSSEAGGAVFGSLSEGIRQSAAISREIAEAMKEQATGTRSVETSLAQLIEASEAIGARMEEQRAETERMTENLSAALRRLADLAESSRTQADAVRELKQSFAAVRYEADRNLASVEALSKTLGTFKV